MTHTTLTEKKIAVTGGTGMLGSHLVAALLNEGCGVRLLVREESDRELLRRTLERTGTAALYDKIEFRPTALNNPHELGEALRGIDIVFHCAARVSFDPAEAEAVVSSNTEIATHIVNSCLECGVELLVHVSSIATLGRPLDADAPITENCILNSLVGRSAYAVSKIYAENTVRRGMQQGLRAVIVNPSIILGEGDWRRGSAALIAQAVRNRLFYTEGVKGYVDVRDVARAMIRLAGTPQAAGKRFIVSAGDLSFRELADRVAETAGHARPRIRVGKTVLQMLARLDDRLSRATGRKRMLPDSFVTDATDSLRYDGSELLRTIDFRYTPLKETVARVVRAYLEDRKSCRP